MNKPVNELISLEIIKHLLGLSDKELEAAYLFDFRVRNALGKETLGDNICPKTFTNFRRRLLEYEEKTGRDLLHEVFEDHRDYLQDEFDIDASTQRMDSTFIEGNIKQLSRIDLIAKVLHNFLRDLPEETVTELPEAIQEFTETGNLELSYTLEPDEIQPTMGQLVEQAAWLVDRFETDVQYAELESFAHLQQILDEQCYRIAELERLFPQGVASGAISEPKHGSASRSPTWRAPSERTAGRTRTGWRRCLAGSRRCSNHPHPPGAYSWDPSYWRAICSIRPNFRPIEAAIATVARTGRRRYAATSA